MIHRLIEQVGDLILFALISLVFGIIKCFAAPEPTNWKERIGSILISVVVGTLAGALSLQYSFGDYTAITISSLASLMSRDIVMSILNNRKHLSDLVKRASENLVDKFTK